MSDKALKNAIGLRINNILNISDCRKDDILSRHSDLKSKEADLFVTEIAAIEDYSFGWKEVIEYTIEHSSVNGILLSGPDGCGKHTAAEIACAFLVNKYNYDIVFLSGEDFSFSDTELKADEHQRQQNIDQNNRDTYTDDVIHSFMEAIFNEYGEDFALCLVIDNTDGYENMETVYKRLEKYLCMYSKEDQPPYIYAVIIEKEPDRLPSALRKRLRTMFMSPPSQEQRAKMLKKLGIDDTIANIISQSTDGLNYAQLRDIGQNLKVHEMIYDLTNDFYPQYLESQTPVSYEEAEKFLSDEKVRLYKKLGELIDKVPELLEKLPAVSALPAVNAAPAVSTQAAESSTAKNNVRKEASYEELLAEEERIDQQQQNAPDKIRAECENKTLGEIIEISLGVSLNDIGSKPVKEIQRG